MTKKGSKLALADPSNPWFWYGLLAEQLPHALQKELIAEAADLQFAIGMLESLEYKLRNNVFDGAE